jgi:hypothetical protein
MNGLFCFNNYLCCSCFRIRLLMSRLLAGHFMFYVMAWRSAICTCCALFVVYRPLLVTWLNIEIMVVWLSWNTSDQLLFISNVCEIIVVWMMRIVACWFWNVFVHVVLLNTGSLKATLNHIWWSGNTESWIKRNFSWLGSVLVYLLNWIWIEHAQFFLQRREYYCFCFF